MSDKLTLGWDGESRQAGFYCEKAVARALLELAEFLGEDRGSGRVLIRHKIKRSDLAAMAGSRQVLGGTGHGMIPTESCPSRPGPSELPSLDGADPQGRRTQSNRARCRSVKPFHTRPVALCYRLALRSFRAGLVT
jgi:hypothetical protein